MNRENIVRMAREAAKEFGSWDDWDSDKPASGPNGNDPHEEREYWILLVEFIAAAEREACAKVCEDAGYKYRERASRLDPEIRDIDPKVAMIANMTCDFNAAAIRARGQT